MDIEITVRCGSRAVSYKIEEEPPSMPNDVGSFDVVEEAVKLLHKVISDLQVAAKV